MSDLLKLPQAETVPVDENRLVYDALREEMLGSNHGRSFLVREFSSTDVLDVTIPYLQPHPPLQRRELQQIRDHLQRFVVAPESYRTISDAIKTVLHSPAVSDHLASKNNVAFALNHLSYADIPVFMAALAEQKPDIENHQAIISRLVGMFALPGFAPDGKTGHVVEDGLQHVGGVFQTFPLSDRVETIPTDIRRSANARFMKSYMEKLSQGGQIMIIAGSGTQDKQNGSGHITMRRLEKATTRLFSLANDPRFGGTPENLLTVPVFMDCQPFDAQGYFKGSPAVSTIAFGLPRFAASPRDVHEIYEENARLGNEHKLEDTPLIVYEPEHRRSLGNSALLQSI